ncbi:MAG: hypothetical protein J6C52_11735 [Clostridia bacterium]|nr:hypothetical protein [Clostridia bacterium]
MMIVGMGSYGMEFFKMILWYCQYEGRKLEFNIIDRREGSEGARSIFRRHFPDLQKTSTAAPHDDAIYDISFYEGVDIQTDALQDRILFENRLQRTDVVIVSLGDDDANIEAALYLRSLFDRVHAGQGKRRMTAVDNCNAKEGAHFMEHTSKPEIYAIVYDELKSGVLHDEAGNSAGPAYLTDHKGISFDIHFIGGMQSMYRHDMIYDQDTEDKAFARHSSWSTISGNSSHFEDHEYNRLSSAAQALYHSQFRKLNCGSCGNTVCRNPSAVCEKQARNEHIRWNAYMRTLGYTFISLEHTCHRAKIHGDLCSWAALNKKKEKEVRKDSIPTDETGGNTNVQAQSDQDRSHPASR